MRTKYLLGAIIPFLIISCRFIGNERIRGNGNMKTETRTASGFSNIDVQGNIDVVIRQDSAYAVRVEADENLLPYISVSTDENTLVIRPKDHENLSSSKAIKVFVSGPQFKNLEASGASSITSENMLSGNAFDIECSGASKATLQLKAPSIIVSVDGASQTTLSGQTKDLTIGGSGASSAKCYELLSENAKVEMSGASDAEVFVSVSLDADASGASKIRYKGDASVNQESSGASSVKKVN